MCDFSVSFPACEMAVTCLTNDEDVARGEYLMEWQASTAGLTSACYSTDETSVLTLAEDGTVRLHTIGPWGMGHYSLLMRVHASLGSIQDGASTSQARRSWSVRCHCSRLGPHISQRVHPSVWTSMETTLHCPRATTMPLFSRSDRHNMDLMRPLIIDVQVADGSPAMRLQGHDRPITCMDWSSAAGTVAVTADADGHIIVHNLVLSKR